jgi:hypothetical protein
MTPLVYLMTMPTYGCAPGRKAQIPKIYTRNIAGLAHFSNFAERVANTVGRKSARYLGELFYQGVDPNTQCSRPRVIIYCLNYCKVSGNIFFFLQLSKIDLQKNHDARVYYNYNYCATHIILK